MPFTPVLINNPNIDAAPGGWQHWISGATGTTRYTFAFALIGGLQLYRSTDSGASFSIIDDTNYPGAVSDSANVFSELIVGGGTGGDDLIRTMMVVPRDGSPGGIIQFCEFDVGTLTWSAVTNIGGGFNTRTHDPLGATECCGIFRHLRADGTEVVVYNTDEDAGYRRVRILENDGGSWTSLALRGSAASQDHYILWTGIANKCDDTVYLFVNKAHDLGGGDYTDTDLICITVAADNTVSADQLIESDVEDPTGAAGQSTASTHNGRPAISLDQTEIAFAYGYWTNSGFPSGVGAVHVGKGDLTGDPLNPTWTVEVVATNTSKWNNGFSNDINATYDAVGKVILEYFGSGNVHVGYGDDTHVAGKLKVYWATLDGSNDGKIMWSEDTGSWSAAAQLWPDPDTDTVSLNGFDVCSDPLVCATGPELACPVGGDQGFVGVPYVGQLVASGGTPPYTLYQITSGSLPPGLSLDGPSGIISGTPTTPGTYPYAATVTDSLGEVSPAIDCEITITAPEPSCPVGGDTAVIGTAYGPFDLNDFIVGGTPPYTFSNPLGFPPGITIDLLTGIISGTPTMLGNYIWSITVTDANGSTATLSCPIEVGPPSEPIVFLPPSTLRYEIPKRRWFPHSYADQVRFHYLDEPSASAPNDQQLLMLSGDSILKSGGNTDNGTDIDCVVIPASNDGGDQRLQKLYIDAMFDADGSGTLQSFIRYNNQTISGPLLSVTGSGYRQQFLQNISSLADLSLYRNISPIFGWTGGPDGPRIYAWEPSGFAQPYLSTFFVTQFLNLSYQGWKHHRRLYAGLISNATVLFTVKTQDGRLYGPVTIPSTSGQFRVVPLIMPHGCKDLSFAYEWDGQGTTFALFLDSFTLETKEWTGPEYIQLAVVKT